MPSTLPSTGLELRSIITSAGELELSLVNVPTSTPKPDEVVVRIEAAPINPSDLGLLLGPADLATAVASVHGGLPLVRAEIPQGLMKAMASRVDQSMPVGNEGAGVVVAAGDSLEAQAMIGKTVAREANAGRMKPTPESSTQEVLAGLVERVTFHNAATM